MNELIALHLIAVICWFAGLFYLPRLFVYHAKTTEETVKAQFQIMEHKLYWYIMMPAMMITLLSGMALMTWMVLQGETHLGWLFVKLILVLFLIFFHFYCGFCIDHFKMGQNQHSERFYRFFNEIPTLLLIAIVLLAVVQPF
ncbi:MAG: protoporphyrinogen oxidase HemJ [Gammaproteobacteria bacterium]|nr:protoporphyrinogen oxidase HemJ [Gammaproteobacteria bacterium]